VSATEEISAGFDAVTQNAAATMLAARRKLMDCAFE
jgi:hypothetical protein